MHTERTNPLLHFSVNELFGRAPSGFDGTLEATLRYITIKHCDGDFTKLKGSFELIVLNVNSDWNENLFASDIENLREGAFCLYLPLKSKQTLPHQLSIEGWKRLNVAPYPIEQYLQKITNTVILTNEKKRSVAIIVEKNIPELFDAIQSVMFRIWDWYYPTKNISDDETALFKAISEEDSNQYIELCQRLVDQYEFEWLYNENKLKGWNNRFVDRQLSGVKSQMESCLRDIALYNNKVDSIYKSYEEFKITYEALIGSRKDDSDEISRFFAQRRNYLHILQIDNESCVFNIVETIEYFDTDAFMGIYNNKRSCLYAAGEDIAQAMNGIFIDGIGKFNVESTFALTGLIALEPQQVGTPYQKNTALHPHLCHYQCLGGNKNYIRDYLLKGQWGQAIDQAIAATKNINFGDATVIEWFVTYLRTKADKKFIVQDDGKFISIQDVLAIMNKQEGTSNG